MGHTNRNLLKKVNRVLVGLLGLLGFSGCGEEAGVLEYGTPYAGYVVKGKVTDAQANGLEGIQVYLQEHESAFFGSKADTIYTDADGNFTYEWAEVGIHEVEHNLIAVDKDSLFKPDTTAIAFKREDFQGGTGSWNEGTATKEISITLDKANTDPKE